MNFWSKPSMRGKGLALGGMTILAAGIAAFTPALAADVIRVVSPYQTTTLDPMRSAAAGNIETYGQLYSRLLRRNSETGALEPGLAETWDISEDGKTYTFHLRDAQFSDGSPITADDVAFSLERIRTDKRSAYPAPLSAVEAVKAADAKTVVVTLKSAFAPFLGNAEIWNMGIVSKADVEKRGEEAAFGTVPVTSGPYGVKQWKPNEKLVLEPNPHYWRKGYPKSDATVELIEIASPETRIAMLKAGEIDAVRAVPWAQIDDLKTVETIDMRLEPSTTIYMTLLNHKREPFSSLEARQAAGMAIDNKAMAAAITRGYAELSGHSPRSREGEGTARRLRHGRARGEDPGDRRCALAADGAADPGPVAGHRPEARHRQCRRRRLVGRHRQGRLRRGGQLVVQRDPRSGPCRPLGGVRQLRLELLQHLL